MIIKEKDQSISFEVTGYEYPRHKAADTGFDHDANWLMVSVTYADNTETRKYKDPCLLTTELECLISELSDIVDGKESLYISDFLEPYLKITAARANEKIVIGMEFVYDTSGDIWRSHRLSEVFTKESAYVIIDELKKMSVRFPER